MNIFMAEKNELKNQVCPVCRKKTLTLAEGETDVPFFGKVFIFSMNCSSCKYAKSDVEAAEKKEPCKYTFDISSEKDLKVRFIKSSEATVKIPHMMTMSPGPGSIGFVTNIEGMLQRVKEIIESTRDSAEDNAEKKKAKNMLKKLMKVMWGREKLKIILEDPSGNSAIISDKAVKSKLK